MKSTPKKNKRLPCVKMFFFSGHLRLYVSYLWKRRCERNSSSLVTTAFRDAVLALIDRRRGEGTGLITCLAGGLSWIDLVLSYLNPLTKDLIRLGISLQVVQNTDEYCERQIK